MYEKQTVKEKNYNFLDLLVVRYRISFIDEKFIAAHCVWSLNIRDEWIKANSAGRNGRPFFNSARKAKPFAIFTAMYCYEATRKIPSYRVIHEKLVAVDRSCEIATY